MPIDEIVLDDRGDESAENRGRDVVRVPFDQRGDAQNLALVEIQSADLIRRHDAGDDAGRARTQSAAQRKVGVEMNRHRGNGAPVALQRLFERLVDEVRFRARELGLAARDGKPVAARLESESVEHVERESHHVEAGTDVGARRGNGYFEFHNPSDNITKPPALEHFFPAPFADGG